MRGWGMQIISQDESVFADVQVELASSDWSLAK